MPFAGDGSGRETTRADVEETRAKAHSSCPEGFAAKGYAAASMDDLTADNGANRSSRAIGF
jgi:AcrR family transcriptional regulator